MKIMHFLSGLDDTFSQVNSHILLTKPLPSVKTAFATISRQESQQKGGSISQTSTKSQATAFVGKFNDQKRNKSRGNSNFQCENCGLKGHIIERCFKLIGYPKDFKFRNKSYNLNKTFSTNYSSTPNMV